MEKQVMVSDINFALFAGNYSPYVLDVNWLQITGGADQYQIYTGRLPEVFIEKRVPLDLFAYGDDWGLLMMEMDMVNSQMSAVKVFFGPCDNTITFRTHLRLRDMEHFGEDFPPCLDRIENSIAEMGHACETVVRKHLTHETAPNERVMS